MQIEWSGLDELDANLRSKIEQQLEGADPQHVQAVQITGRHHAGRWEVQVAARDTRRSFVAVCSRDAIDAALEGGASAFLDLFQRR
jgi:hypothetical protein